MDNLARCAMLAKRDGMSYGQWMAMYGEKVINKKEEPVLPPGWKLCEGCGKPFQAKRQQRFCEISCRDQAYKRNHREKMLERNRKALQRYYERKKKNEGSC